MRATMMVDREWLAERRRLGIDGKDEVWDGVLHVAPTPTTDHQRFEGAVEAVLRPLALARSFELFHMVAILDPRDHDRNYRIPDVLVVEPTYVLRLGTEGPVELAIEILSPDDESREKLPFYAERGVKELWLVDPETRAHEVYLLRGKGYGIVVADRAGITRAPALDLELSLAGTKLRIAWASGSAEI